MKGNKFEYFTAAEAGQYTFYRIPKALFTDERFRELSCGAKVLYGMMLDRMGLSIKNQWLDSGGRVYIVYTVEDVMAVMGCGSQKAVRLIKELDAADGIGLIEKKRIGLGRPNRIYVKNFMVRESGGPDTNGGSRQGASGQDAPGRQAASDRPHTFGGQGTFDGQERASVHENEETAADNRERETDETACMEAAAVDETAYMADAVMDESAYMADAAADEFSYTEDAVMDESAHMEMESADSEADAGNAVFVPENELDGETEADAYEPDWWELETDAGNGQDDPLCAVPAEKCAAFGRLENERTLKEIRLEENRQAAGASAVDIVDNVDKMGIVDTVENVDNCHQAAAHENQNTGLHPLVQGRKNCPAGRRFADEEIRKMFLERPEFPKTQEQNGGNQDSLMAQYENAEWRDAKRNKTDITKTENSKKENSRTEGIKTEKNETDYSACSLNLSYQSSDPSGSCSIQGYGRQEPEPVHKKQALEAAGAIMDDYRSRIRENISYSCIDKRDAGKADELVELMVDAMMLPDSSSIRVGGGERPASIVKSRFMKLKFPHIQYVLWCLQRHTGRIYNIKAYLLTALYNSVMTISSFYHAEVRHDLYGCGC